MWILKAIELGVGNVHDRGEERGTLDADAPRGAWWEVLVPSPLEGTSRKSISLSLQPASRAPTPTPPGRGHHAPLMPGPPHTPGHAGVTRSVSLGPPPRP